MDFLVRVVDAFARLKVNERNAAPLVVGVIHEAAAAAQALLPRQHPALAQHAVDSQVAGIEAWPLDWHHPGQDEIRFVDQQFAVSRHVQRIAGQVADHLAGDGFGHITAGDFASDEA